MALAPPAMARAASRPLRARVTPALTARFNDYVGDPLWPVLTHLLFAALTWWFVQGGVQKGVERTLRWMMPALFIMSCCWWPSVSPCPMLWPVCATS